MRLTLFLAVFGTMIAESIRAASNERAQRLRGGVEPPGDVYTAMRVVYPMAFAAMFAESLWRGEPSPAWWLSGAALFTAAKGLKWWAIATLGPAWTFRVIVVPGAPLAAGGPYRLMRHPNYAAVVGELAGIALAGGAGLTGPVALASFSVLLWKRVTLENRALAEAAP